MRPPEGARGSVRSPREDRARVPGGRSRSAPVLFKFPTRMGAKPQGFLKIPGRDDPGCSDGSPLGRLAPQNRPHNPDMPVRDATPDDWPAIWPFLHEIVAAGETYAYDRDMTEDQARRLWMVEPPGRTVVAV